MLSYVNVAEGASPLRTTGFSQAAMLSYVNVAEGASPLRTTGL